jgi:hypothetical protein
MSIPVYYIHHDDGASSKVLCFATKDRQADALHEIIDTTNPDLAQQMKAVPYGSPEWQDLWDEFCDVDSPDCEVSFNETTMEPP